MKKKVYFLVVAIFFALALAVTAVYAVPTPFIYFVEEGAVGMLVCESGTAVPSVGADGSAMLKCLGATIAGK